MASKLVNFCLSWTLVLGCWGGVIAAAACPHAGCETAAPSPAGVSNGGASGGHEHCAPASEDHSGHQGGHGDHAAAPPEQGSVLSGDTGLDEVSRGHHNLNCTHCVGRPEAPPSSNFELQTGSANKTADSAAPAAVTRVEPPPSVFPQEVTPAQHAPPGGADRHLLLSIFRI